MDESKHYGRLFRWAVDAIGLTITVDRQGIVRHIGKAYAGKSLYYENGWQIGFGEF